MDINTVIVDSKIQMKPAKLMLFAPVLFPLHVLEEKPGFVKWFNALVTSPESQITEMDFYAANIGAFVITLILAVTGWKFQKQRGGRADYLLVKFSHVR